MPKLYWTNSPKCVIKLNSPVRRLAAVLNCPMPAAAHPGCELPVPESFSDPIAQHAQHTQRQETSTPGRGPPSANRPPRASSRPRSAKSAKRSAAGNVDKAETEFRVTVKKARSNCRAAASFTASLQPSQVAALGRHQGRQAKDEVGQRTLHAEMRSCSRFDSPHDLGRVEDRAFDAGAAIVPVAARCRGLWSRS